MPRFVSCVGALWPAARVRSGDVVYACKLEGEGELRRSGDGAGVLLAMSWGYFALAEYSLEYFHCKQVDGVRLLYAEPSIECYKFGSPNTHTNLFTLAMWALIVYPIGMLLLIAFVLFKYRPSHPNKEMRRIGAYRQAVAKGDTDPENLKLAPV